MKIVITKGKGWYRDCVGDVFEVTGRHPQYDAYYVKVWSDVFNEWQTNQCWVSDGNYEIINEESPSVTDLLANLSRRVSSLEQQLRDTQGNIEKLAEELADTKYNAKKHIERLTCDIITLDERSQVLNAINKFYEEGNR